MSSDLDLFGDAADDRAEERQQAQDPRSELAARWQVDLLRKGLDSRGLTTMVERQDAIEAITGRPVESLRTLTQVEALAVLKKFGETASRTRGGSAWDERDEDTWIDRL